MKKSLIEIQEASKLKDVLEKDQSKSIKGGHVVVEDGIMM